MTIYRGYSIRTWSYHSYPALRLLGSHFKSEVLSGSAYSLLPIFLVIGNGGAKKLVKMTEIEKSKIQVLIKVGYNLSDLKVSYLNSYALFHDWSASYIILVLFEIEKLLKYLERFISGLTRAREHLETCASIILLPNLFPYRFINQLNISF